MLWQIIIASVLTVGTLVFKLKNNLKRWRAGNPDVNHGKEWFYMGLANIPSILLFSQLDLKSGLAATGMIIFFLWLFFNGLYAKSKGKDFWYLGDATGDKAALSDRFLRSLPSWLHKSLLVGGFLIFLILYILWISQHGRG